MENNVDNLINALELYESLDVSDSAKKTFFDNYVLKEASLAGFMGGAKKAGGAVKSAFVASMNFLVKKWGGIDGTVKNMSKAMDGLNKVIQGSSDVNDNQKQIDIKVIEEYRSRMEAAVAQLKAADAKVKQDIESNPANKATIAGAKANQIQHEQVSKNLDTSTTVMGALNAYQDCMNFEKKTETDADTLECYGDVYKNTLKEKVENLTDEGNLQPDDLNKSIKYLQDILQNAEESNSKSFWQDLLNDLQSQLPANAEGSQNEESSANAEGSQNEESSSDVESEAGASNNTVGDQQESQGNEADALKKQKADLENKLASEADENKKADIQKEIENIDSKIDALTESKSVKAASKHVD